MPGNPLIAQGTLNRVKAAVQFDTFAALNISASYLGKEGIRLQLGGTVTTQINSMTGIVTSPEPYQPIVCTINLLKTQALGAAFKAQLELLSLLGDFTVYPDAVTLPPFPITNGSILNAEPGPFDGNDALYVITLGGAYIINQGLWT